MRRKFMILGLTVIFLLAFGALLRNPPSVMDVITGATPKAKQAAQEAAGLTGNYIFCLNPETEDFKSPKVRRNWQDFAGGKTETVPAAPEKIKIFISETDYPLQKYGKKLCTRLQKAGIQAELSPCSDSMLLSRAKSGRYRAFLAEEKELKELSWQPGDILVLAGGQMK